MSSSDCPTVGRLIDPIDYEGERHCCSECCKELRKNQKVLIEWFYGEFSYTCMGCAKEVVDAKIEDLEIKLREELRSYVEVRKELV